MQLTFEHFEQRFSVLGSNFGFKTKPEIIPFIFEQLEDLGEEEFDRGFGRLMSMTRLEWDEKYSYGTTPTVADWKSLFGGKRKITIKDSARMEVEKILHEARYGFSDWVPENKITKKVLSSFNNGLKTIHFDLFDSYNENKKNMSFYKKDLIEKWLAYNDSKDSDNGILIEMHSSVMARLKPHGIININTLD